MNEVTKIHLGRQAFTISVEAHRELRQYLSAIEKQVGDKDVVNEIELRMAELLAEHGVSGDKVILPADVEFLKEQLGSPADFKEDGDESTSEADKTPESKKLFRDTENGMVAGVAAGLAQYTGLDVLLVRILFIIAIFTGGWGILLYIVLWLLVAEARTSSERLQMAGKPVNVGSLKEIVERADVKGVARRTGSTLAGPINSFFRIVLKVIGVVFMITGLAALLGLIATESYFLLKGGSVLQDNIFPVGLKEHLVVHIAVFIGALVSLFIVLFGVAMFKRKWPIPTWVTAVLVGMTFLGLAAGGALVGDVAPTVRDRYEAHIHTTVRQVEPFTAVNFVGNDIVVRYRMSATYSVSMRYFDQPDLSSVKTTVKDGTLTVDTSGFDNQRTCHTVCLPESFVLVITINSPNPPTGPDAPEAPDVPAPLTLRKQLQD